MIDVSVPVKGEKNVKIIVCGILHEELGLTVLVKDLPRMKLSSALWLIQEKLGLVLWWEEGKLIMPMESRNSIRLDRGWEPPKEWNGTLYLSSHAFDNGPVPKHFTFELDFDR